MPVTFPLVNLSIAGVDFEIVELDIMATFVDEFDTLVVASIDEVDLKLLNLESIAVEVDEANPIIVMMRVSDKVKPDIVGSNAVVGTYVL